MSGTYNQTLQKAQNVDKYRVHTSEYGFLQEGMTCVSGLVDDRRSQSDDTQRNWRNSLGASPRKLHATPQDADE